MSQPRCTTSSQISGAVNGVQDVAGSLLSRYIKADDEILGRVLGKILPILSS